VPSMLVVPQHCRPGWVGTPLCFVQEPDTGIVWPAHIVELSARGARLQGQRHWEADAVLSVEFLGLHTTQPHTAALKVTRAERDGAGVSVTCGVFLRPVPLQLVHAVLGLPATISSQAVDEKTHVATPRATGPSF
jgi:hypothetical protein